MRNVCEIYVKLLNCYKHANCSVICESTVCLRNQCEIAEQLQICNSFRLKFYPTVFDSILFLLQNPVLDVIQMESVLGILSLFPAGDTGTIRFELPGLCPHPQLLQGAQHSARRSLRGRPDPSRLQKQPPQQAAAWCL